MELTKLHSFSEVVEAYDLAEEVARLISGMQFNETGTIIELQEFQAYAYGVHGSTSSRQLAVAIVMDILTRDNFKEFMEGFPEGMLADFTA